jgi:hypothetical protein
VRASYDPAMLTPTFVLTLLLAAGDALPHVPGERMAFDIEFHGLPIGSAEISVGNPAAATLPITLEARTAGLARVVELRERLVTDIDVYSGLPRTSLLAAAEGGYRHVSTTVFDRPNSRVKVREIGKHDISSEHAVPPQTLDFLALVFALRVLPLEPGSTRSFDVLAGTQVSRVNVQVVGREMVKSAAGTSQALKVRVPTSFSGEFSEKSPTHVWLTDDHRRVVVRITTDFAVGDVTASLVSYDGGERHGTR